jgi:hypothetical protein
MAVMYDTPRQFEFIVLFIFRFDSMIGNGQAVAQLVEALRYKPKDCGFDSQFYHWNFH